MAENLGVDISPGMLAKAKKRLGKLTETELRIKVRECFPFACWG